MSISPLHIKIIVSLSYTLSIQQNDLEFFLELEKKTLPNGAFSVCLTSLFFFKPHYIYLLNIM